VEEAEAAGADVSARRRREFRSPPPVEPAQGRVQRPESTVARVAPVAQVRNSARAPALVAGAAR